ncbi:MAG: iron chelate uptake ABC transporter family permease subunit, partial [Candidatus Eremiobacterota bacterium]
LRGMALMGDTLGHAVLPGVGAAFLLTGQKAMLPLMAGAAAAGMLGTASVWAIRRFSRLKEDSAMGLVLTSFFGLGIVLLTVIQKSGSGSQSGLDHFLFGQAAALGPDDLAVLGAVAAVCVVTVAVYFKELTVTSFDPIFAASIGLKVGRFNALLMGLTTLAVVAAIPAVGVVLVSAMLVTPAAAAQLVSRRMGPMLLMSAGLGMGAGAVGALFSFLAQGMPTGPCMVLAASVFFLAAYLFSPDRGLLARAWRRAGQSRRIRRENLVKSVYRVMEDHGMPDAVPVEDVAALRREPPREVLHGLRGLVGLVRLERGQVRLTAEGVRMAERLVRNHRLWELYLTRQADIREDHVHRDAEEIEHVLGADVVAQLEDLLEHPATDPHGRRIPQ